MKTSTFLPFLPALASANVGVYWFLNDNSPKDGFTEINFPMNVSDTPRETNYYFAQQFGFDNASMGYTGLQPRADKNGAQYIRAVFSSFEDNATSTDEQCSSGADGGGGVSCGIELYAPYDHPYVLNVKKEEGSRKWKGTLVDEKLGNTTHIGSYTMPDFAGNIKDSYLGFVEYYAGSTERNDNCDLPVTSVTFGKPSSPNKNEEGKTSHGKLNGPYAYGPCTKIVPFKKEKSGDGGWYIKYGGGGGKKGSGKQDKRHEHFHA